MRSLVLLLLLLLTSPILWAQTMLSGKVTNLPIGAVPMMALDYWNRDEWKQLAADSLDADGMFQMKFTPPVEGEYRLRIWGKPEYNGDFLILKKENQSKYVLPFDCSQLKNGGPLVWNTGKEASIFFNLMIWLKQRDTYMTGYAEADAAYRIAQHQFFEKTKGLMLAEKGTFTADIIAPCLMGNDYPETLKTDSASIATYRKEHSLDGIPFNDDRVLLHWAFIKAMSRHWKLYHDNHWPFQEAMDAVMNKALGNDEVAGFLFRFFLDKCIDHKDEAALTHLLNWYAPDCASEEAHVEESTRNLVKALETCKPGNKIPNLTCPTLDGKVMSLHEVCKKNTYTILQFWRTNCSHCKEFEPELEKIYQDFHQKGIEIYSVAADKEEQVWRSFEQQNPKPWISTYLDGANRKDFNKRFPVPSTPTFFLLDQNGVVVNRMIMRSKLREILTGVVK
ncbi:MAG: TlpA family protein disulfide reductase [Flavobacteriales bacterium]